MKIVITGANGRLAKAFISLLKNETLYLFTKQELNCSDRDQVVKMMHLLKPDIIFHCAAMTDVEACEKQPMQAFVANSLAVQYMAEASSNSQLFIFSSDYVFAQSKHTAYVESDDPTPLNIYALSKWLAEQSVSHFPNTYVIRTSWLFGGSGDFVDRIINQAKNQQSIAVVADQIGSPTYIQDLVQWCWHLRHYEPGLYHLVNSGSCSRYEWAKEIVRQFSLDVEVVSILSGALNQEAVRPERTILSTDKYHFITNQTIRDWKEAFLDYAKAYV